MDRLTKEQRHKNMVAVKAKGTKPELLLAKAMWSAGLHYRKNDKTVFGCPDFVLKGKKIAIFVDGEMWHGKDWEHQKDTFKSNRNFWIPKIERNIERDKENPRKDYAKFKDIYPIIRFFYDDEFNKIIKNGFPFNPNIKKEVINQVLTDFMINLALIKFMFLEV